MDPTIKDQLLRRCSAGPGDILLFAVGQHASVNKTLDRLRVYVAHELGLVDHVSFDAALQFEKINSLGFSCSLRCFFFLSDFSPGIQFCG